MSLSFTEYPTNTKHLYNNFIQRQPNVFAVGIALYKCLMFCVCCVLRSKLEGGGPRVVVSTAAFHARVRGSVPGLGGFKETKMFLPHPRVKHSIFGSLRDREVACAASDRQGSNFESCVWRTVSSHSSPHPQEVLLAQFSLYAHKGGLKPFHFFLNSNHHESSRTIPNKVMSKIDERETGFSPFQAWICH